MNFGDTSHVLEVIRYGVYLLRSISIFNVSLYDFVFSLFAMGLALLLVHKMLTRTSVGDLISIGSVGGTGYGADVADYRRLNPVTNGWVSEYDEAGVKAEADRVDEYIGKYSKR